MRVTLTASMRDAVGCYFSFKSALSDPHISILVSLLPTCLYPTIYPGIVTVDVSNLESQELWPSSCRTLFCPFLVLLTNEIIYARSCIVYFMTHFLLFFVAARSCATSMRVAPGCPVNHRARVCATQPRGSWLEFRSPLLVEILHTFDVNFDEFQAKFGWRFANFN